MSSEDRIKRASKAASVRLGERGESARIRVDIDAAQALERARRRAHVNDPLSEFERGYCSRCEFHGTPHCIVPSDRRASLILCTGFRDRPMDTVTRAKTAAAARWGGRGESARIRVDIDAARALERVPESERRALASDAIRRAVDERGRA